jgi:hypothetical protein
MPSINNTFFRGMTGCIVVKFMKLETARAWALEDLFEHFWTYKSVRHAGDFLDFWTWRALRSRIEPMRKVARRLRSHQELLLNWFRAQGRNLQWRRRGSQQQNPSGDQTILRLSYLRSDANCPVSHVRFAVRMFLKIPASLTSVLLAVRRGCTGLQWGSQ